MTTGADREPFPGQDDDRPPPHGRQSNREPSGPSAEQLSYVEDTLPRRGRRTDDERHGLLHLADRILVSPGATFRLLVCIAVLVTLFILGAGLLDVRIDVGPVHIGPDTGQSSQR
ncbi:hypothetical protein [Amycolatopsis sp. MtRt-6]|uniref:hypothetical protein n=1 Tax=Amycolatopsis sp. MtRt-6 TaxID=2792782 RepID=UPI001A90165A|nr:hypothetical protein [Amycolatopsis sp. MtRt-6]